MKTARGLIIENAMFAYNNYGKDLRRKEYRQLAKIGMKLADIAGAAVLHRYRSARNRKNWNATPMTHIQRKEILAIAKELPLYDHSAMADWQGDWLMYIRPTSNGEGWVMIAPDERANNVYVTDPVLCRMFAKKYGVSKFTELVDNRAR